MAIHDIFANAQYAARGNLARVQDPRAGEVVIPAAVPLLSETPARFSHLGRALGADTEAVLSELLGLDQEQIKRLRRTSAI